MRLSKRQVLSTIILCIVGNLFNVYLGVDLVYAQEIDFCASKTVEEIPQIECEALVTFFKSTGGNNWRENSGWLITDTPCSWYGVTCHNGHITNLHLGFNQLNGTIAPEITNLSNLQELSLYGNLLSGNIPPELGGLVKLERLSLNINELSGNIPPELGNLVRLKILELYRNQLSGRIPLELGNLTKLQTFSVSYNRLSISNFTCSNIADIPELECKALASFYKNTDGLNWKNSKGWLLTSKSCNWFGVTCENGHVTALYLSDQLSGRIPPELENLTELQSLVLVENQLEGAIPEELGNLINLRGLNLSDNRLEGNIPSTLSNLSDLQYLDLAQNHFSGHIPPGLGNLNNLEGLDLSNNDLDGHIPPELGSLRNLERLYLNDNQLSGSIPASLGKLTNLKSYLDLHNNRLSGNIPSELGNLVKLGHVLDLSDNPLNGALPQSLINLDLYGFGFKGTHLCEPIETTFQTWIREIPIVFSSGIFCPPTEMPETGSKQTLPGLLLIMWGILLLILGCQLNRKTRGCITHKKENC